MICSHVLAMSHILSIPAFAPGALSRFIAEPSPVPSDLLIPAPPRARRAVAARREPAWREAMRWSLIGLTASWAAGEVALAMLGA
jgi:hypothetical protein